MLALAIYVLAARRAMGHAHLRQHKGSHLPDGVAPPRMASTCPTLNATYISCICE